MRLLILLLNLFEKKIVSILAYNLIVLAMIPILNGYMYSISPNLSLAYLGILLLATLGVTFITVLNHFPDVKDYYLRKDEKDD